VAFGALAKGIFAADRVGSAKKFASARSPAPTREGACAPQNCRPTTAARPSQTSKFLVSCRPCRIENYGRRSAPNCAAATSFGPVSPAGPHRHYGVESPNRFRPSSLSRGGSRGIPGHPPAAFPASRAPAQTPARLRKRSGCSRCSLCSQRSIERPFARRFP